MTAITHLLDTSALLAHYFDEPGAREVNELWLQAQNRLAICVLSIPELKGRLLEEISDAREVDRVFDLYVNQLTTSIAVSRAVAEEALRLREAASTRLPLVDACIAACAKCHSCTLVHRDPHLDGIPVKALARLRLPDK